MLPPLLLFMTFWALGAHGCQPGVEECFLASVELTYGAGFPSVDFRKRARLADVIEPVQELNTTTFGRWVTICTPEGPQPALSDLKGPSSGPCCSRVWRASLMAQNTAAPWLMLQFRALNLSDGAVLYLYTSTLASLPPCTSSSMQPAGAPAVTFTSLLTNPEAIPEPTCFPACTPDSPYCQRLTRTDVLSVSPSSAYTSRPLKGSQVVLQYEGPGVAQCVPDAGRGVPVDAWSSSAVAPGTASAMLVEALPTISLRATSQGKQLASTNIYSGAAPPIPAGRLIEAAVTGATGGTCHEDAACVQPWGEYQARGIVLLITSRGGTCTGSLINNPGRRLLVLTANHCIVTPTGNTQEGLANWVALFNYERTSCGSNPTSRSQRFSLAEQWLQGLNLVFRDPVSDVALLELTQVSIPPDFRPVFLGWSADTAGIDQRQAPGPTGTSVGPRAPSAAPAKGPPGPPAVSRAPGSQGPLFVGTNGLVVLHHPSADVTKIAISSFPPLRSVYQYSVASRQSEVATHWLVSNYTEGSTEDGSSGAPLFDFASGLLVGYLSGGQAFCGNELEDYYGMMQAAWSRGLWEFLGGDGPTAYTSLPSYPSAPSPASTSG